MRDVTTAQLAVLKKPWRSVFWRVKIADGGGTLRDWTDLNGIDHVAGISFGDSLDQGGISGEIQLYYRRFDDNASPYISSGRLLNYLDVWRTLTIEIAVVPIGDTPSSTDWVEVADGRVDDIDVAQNPARVSFRSKLLAENMDAYIEEIRVQGGSSKSILETINDLLVSWGTETAVARGTVPASFGVKEYKQQKMPVFEACSRLAQQIGWDFRVRWDDSGGDWDLVLSQPPRSSPTSDLTLNPELYKAFTNANNPVANVRNVVKVFYGNSGSQDNLGNDERSVVTRTDSTSISRYGRRFMELSESSSSLIQTQTQAEDLADFAIADLAEPTLLFGIQLLTPMWPIEVNDYITFEADGLIFDTDTSLAVTSWRIEALQGQPPTMSLQLRGQPGLGVDRWLKNEARLGKTTPSDDLAPEAPTIAATNTALGGEFSVDYPAFDRDFDQIEFHASPTASFTPSSSTLVSSGRATRFSLADLDVGTTRYLKGVVRDLKGNKVTTSEGSITSQGIDKNKLADTLRQAFAKATKTADQDPLTSGDTVEWESVPIGNSSLFDLAGELLEPDDAGIWRIDLQVNFQGTSLVGAYVTIEGTVSGEVARSNTVTGSGGFCTIKDYLDLNSAETESYEVVAYYTSGTGAGIEADDSFWIVERTIYEDV